MHKQNWCEFVNSFRDKFWGISVPYLPAHKFLFLGATYDYKIIGKIELLWLQKHVLSKERVFVVFFFPLDTITLYFPNFLDNVYLQDDKKILKKYNVIFIYLFYNIFENILSKFFFL